MIEGKRVVVTGGAGFIGSHLVEALHSVKSNEVISLDNYFTGTKDNHISGVRYIDGHTGTLLNSFPKSRTWSITSENIREWNGVSTKPIPYGISTNRAPSVSWNIADPMELNWSMPDRVRNSLMEDSAGIKAPTPGQKPQTRKWSPTMADGSDSISQSHISIMCTDPEKSLRVTTRPYSEFLRDNSGKENR